MWNEDQHARSTVAWLLQPLTLDEFANRYYEREPLHIPRKVADYYHGYFNLSELENVLYGSEVPADGIGVFKDGIPARAESYTQKTGRKNQRKDGIDIQVIDGDRVSALFAHGCSIVLDRVQTYSPNVRRLCHGLEAFFRHRVGANMYLTPPNSQGFAPHYDTHDTMLLQIEGSKRWRIYRSGFELPLDDDEKQRFKAVKPALGEPILEIDVHAGDLLYLPRGFMHEGKAGDGFSMHLTLGLYSVKWFDVLKEALTEGGFNESFLRRTIATTSSPNFTAAELQAILQSVFSEARLAAAAERLEREYIVDRRNILTGQLQQLVTLPSLTSDSSVAIRDDMFYEIAEDEKSATLSFSGKVLKLPKAAAAIIHELEAVSSAVVGALEKHDEKTMAIVQRLIKEGFVIQRSPSDFNGTEAVA
ncbi:MAG: cupin domain-containing protein [Vulcanimicrobiaceae bacterium]